MKNKKRAEVPKPKTEHALAAEIVRLFQQFQPGGKFGPIEDRFEYEQQIRSLPMDEQELARELTNYADLIRYFAERKMKTGSDIADGMFAAAKLPIPERVQRIREINRLLMERLDDAGKAAEFRN